MRLTALRLLAVVLVSAAACAAADRTASPVPSPPGAPTAEERLGIKVEGIRRSAAGYMLDFRFQVVDPEKAKPIMDRSIKPYVIDEASGAKFVIPSSPKVGPMRQTTRHAEAGRSYWLLFANPGRYIKPDRLVTVVVGDVRLEHLVVK